MPAIPPLPPGFKLVSGGQPPAHDPDLLKPLLDAGAVPTNGYRTPGDTQRLRSEAYPAANDSAHLNGDAVDLTPGKSGLTLAQLQARADAIARRYGGTAAIHNNSHVHLNIPGWGMAPGTPGTPHAGIPPLPSGFKLQQRGALNASTALTPSGLTATGSVHDGDTFKLSNGQNGRLFGADAYELGQSGHRSNGAVVPLGGLARDFMAGRVPGQPFNLTGGSSYGRPVGTVGTPDNDPAQALLRNGLGLADTRYLNGSPEFARYMEAERLARLNRLGGHATDAVSPSDFRHGPFAEAEPSTNGKGVALFKDEPTPFQGLRPEIAKGYIGIWQDMNSKPEDLLAYAKANGFQLDPADVRKSYEARAKTHNPGSEVTYRDPPAPLIDPGDGRTGATLRGFADPFNMIDELGGLADTVGIPSPGAGGPRENIFNSDRRFGDILWNNIDQNRAILGHDDLTHPNYRLGGQLASGLAIPAFGVEGVAAGATERALASGASRFAAEIAGKKALAQRLAAIGGAEGGAMGFGAGEGGPIDRLPNAALGAAGGAIAAPVLGVLGDAAINAARPVVVRAGRKVRGMFAAPASAPAAPITAMRGVPPLPPGTIQRVNGGAAEGSDFTILRPQQANGVPPVDPAMLQRANGGYAVGEDAANGAQAVHDAAAMAADQGPVLVGPELRQRDYLNVGDLPPLPEGFTLEQPFGVTRPMGERLSAEEMAKLAEGVDPRSVLPRPGNTVETLSEAERANPGRFVEREAPDEFEHLPVLKIPSKKDLYKTTRIRGPLDMTQRLRTMGGIQDQGGELAHLGIDNTPRRMDFGSNEQFLGKLVHEDGMPLDEAAFRLWEDGYFPDFNERPTPDDLVQRLKLEQMGQRFFDPADAEHVANFEAAQGERFRIEAAKAEGSPLVDERGESINLDDLVANTPPAEAYEDMPRLTGKVGNINLARLDKPQDVGQLINQVASRVGGFSAAARGKITHEETQRLAEELGLTPEQLLKRRQGQALNAEQLFAARSLVQKSRQVVGALAKKAVGGSDEDLTRFRAAWLRHVALEEQVSGATAEAGRALSQQRALAKGASADARAVRDYLKASGGREKIEDAAQAIVDLMEDPAKANHFMREAVKPRWRDKFNELYINSLLSGPVTHAVNFVGNALTTSVSFPETAMAAAIGKLTRSEDRAFFREVGARAAGLADSSLDALKAAKKAFLTGEASDEVTKVENVHHQAIGGVAGSIIRTPTKALTASDEFWSGVLRGAELRQAAWRRAAGEGGSTADIRTRFEALMRAPPEDLLKQAENSARYYTFRQPLGPVGRAVQQISNNFIFGKLIVPFVRTPINILKFAGERSVVGLAMPEVRAALRAGGRSRDEALAKITFGSGLSLAAFMAAADGKISGGGPTNPSERAALLQSGWQPYSIKVGNRWVSYSRFDPVSTLFGVAADFAETGKWATTREADEIALKLAESIAKNITSKTWLSGLSDAFEVLSDPERYGRNYFQRLISRMAVPALLNQTAQATDPNLRDARTIMDAIKARVPVLSQSVPARLNVWGEPIANGDAVGPDIVSPFYASRASNDPVKQEMARIRAPLSMPQRSLTVNGKKVELTPEQFADYVHLSGSAAKTWLDSYIKSDEWRAMSDDERRDAVKDGFKDFRDAARDELKRHYPELQGSVGEAPPVPPPSAAPAAGLPPLPPGFTLQAPVAPAAPPRVPVPPKQRGMFAARP